MIIITINSQLDDIPGIHRCVMASSMLFVDPVPSDLETECPICFGLLSNPQLTDCCGHHFCRDCLDRVSKDKKPCPICNSPFKAMADKSLSRVIGGLKIYCTNKIDGCNWKGEVRGLEGHQKLGDREGECLYVEIPCINRCGNKIQRHLLKKHEDETCSKRPVADAVGLSRRIDEVVKENESLKATVGNLYQLNEVNRQTITNLTHQLNSCLADMTALKQTVQALSIGERPRVYETSLPLSVLPKATPMAPPPIVTNHHQVSTPSVETSLRIVPYEFTFDNYDRRHSNAEMWMSRPFYTHPGGYKLCIRVAARGLGSGELTHVSVHTYLMKGEYDDMLKWPFQGSITIQLRNQIGDECHHEQTTIFNDKTPNQYCSRFA